MACIFQVLSFCLTRCHAGLISSEEGGDIMPKIISAIAKDDYKIEIYLANGHKIIYDMKSRLQGVRFCKLVDREFYKTFHIENGNSIVWDNLCQINIDEIINNIKK